MKKENKYCIGKDEHKNSIFDYERVCKDFIKFLEDSSKGKIKKFSDDLYHVFTMKWTIAHYDKENWLHTYNQHWSELAMDILRPFWHKERNLSCIQTLCTFLNENDKLDIFPYINNNIREYIVAKTAFKGTEYSKKIKLSEKDKQYINNQIEKFSNKKKINEDFPLFKNI